MVRHELLMRVCELGRLAAASRGILVVTFVGDKYPIVAPHSHQISPKKLTALSLSFSLGFTNTSNEDSPWRRGFLAVNNVSVAGHLHTSDLIRASREVSVNQQE